VLLLVGLLDEGGDSFESPIEAGVEFLFGGTLKLFFAFL
jgi:hypothetical protein